ncbi:MAG: hypothetical protein AAF669_02940 [Pseudomonadota bacterium]
MPDRTGGGRPRLYQYKNSWIIHNSQMIREAASQHHIPADLLASIAWIEVGGMPDVMDSIAFPVRSFDWSGPGFIDRNFTTTRHPLLTSVGSVSIQLRVAARTLGLQADNMDYQQLSRLKRCLETDRYNLQVVAQHLYDLIRYDYPDSDTRILTEEQFIIAASRYNRGTARKRQDYLDSIKAPPGHKNRTYSEYGRAAWRRRETIIHLLSNGG